MLPQRAKSFGVIRGVLVDRQVSVFNGEYVERGVKFLFDYVNYQGEGSVGAHKHAMFSPALLINVYHYHTWIYAYLINYNNKETYIWTHETVDEGCRRR